MKGSGRLESEGNKPIVVLDIDISTPIDVKKAIEQLGGMPMMFYMMLEKFEDMTLMSEMEKLAKAYDDKDFYWMKEHAHSIKGAAGYICASKLHYACYFIQEHHHFDRFKEQMEYYPTLLEAAVEFRVFSRQILAEFHSKFLQ